MISIPVKMYTATRSTETISFKQINKDTGNRVKQPKVDAVTNEPVENFVRGYEYEKGKFVLLEDEEIAELTPDRTSSIELVTFLDKDELDPMYFDTPYHLGANVGGDKPYVLLDKALREKEKIAIGKFVMKSKEYLCAIIPVGEKGLSISTLRWHQQLRDNADIAPDDVDVKDQEVQMAGQLIDAMAEDFDITVLHDTYTDELRELIEKKAKGTLVTPSQPEQEQEEEGISDDIFAALEASLTATKAKAV